MAGQKKKPLPPVAAKPVHERGAEHQAEKLTGARAQRGMLPTGQPRFVYEVKWAGINKKTKVVLLGELLGYDNDFWHH